VVFGGEEEGGGVRSGPGAARTILLFHIINARPSKQPQKIPRDFGWRIHCGVEVTEKEEDAMQVNKTLAHNLSLTLLGENLSLAWRRVQEY
jgi:hypothetical protein